MQDPISDLLTRIRNGYMAKKDVLTMPYSKVKEAILNVLTQEGYIIGYQAKSLVNNKSELEVTLKYYKGKPVITKLDRVSRPGLRIYKGSKELPKVLGGLGTAIISTPKGIVSDKKAKELSLGGEVICLVE